MPEPQGGDSVCLSCQLPPVPGSPDRSADVCEVAVSLPDMGRIHTVGKRLRDGVLNCSTENSRSIIC